MRESLLTADQVADRARERSREAEPPPLRAVPRSPDGVPARRTGWATTARPLIAGECEVGPDDLSTQAGGDRSDREAAEKWLADDLPGGERHDRHKVKARPKAVGLVGRTFQPVRQRLGVEDRQEGFPALSGPGLPAARTCTAAVGAIGGATGPTRGIPVAEPHPTTPAAQSPQPPEARTTEPSNGAAARRCEELYAAGRARQTEELFESVERTTNAP